MNGGQILAHGDQTAAKLHSNPIVVSLSNPYGRIDMNERSHMILIILLYALCASMFTIAKAVLDYSQPIFFVAVRMIIAGSMLLAYELFRNKKFPKINWRLDGGLLVQLVLFHIYVVYVFDLWALQFMTSSRSALWFSLTPFFTAAFAYALKLETMTWKKILGLCIGLGGMMFDILPAMFSEGRLQFSGADIMMLITVGSGAYGWIIFKMLMDRHRYSNFFLNGFAMIVGGFMALATSCITEIQYGVPVHGWFEFIALTLAIVMLGNIFYYTLYGYLLRFYTNTFISFAGFFCPFFAVLFGALLLDEPLSMRFFISLGIVCVGLYVFHHEEL